MVLRSPTAQKFLKSSLTACALFTASDVVAQRVVTVPNSEHPAPYSTREFFKTTYDPHRTVRMALTGLLVNGPWFMAGFAAMDKLYPVRHAISTTAPAWRAPLMRAIKKALTFHTIVNPPYLVMFVSFTTAVEYLQSTRFGAPLPPDHNTELVDRLQSRVGTKVVPMIIAGTFLWPWFNTLNFWLFNGTARVIAMNTVGLGWNAYLSWYLATHPHSEEEVEEVFEEEVGQMVMVEAAEL
ncbi:hypothetical protein GGF31_002692 [Allomyces arbusculus]|nr:hypothetical protein GGF31_002692 [Allomyces arbusculus]